MKRIKHILSFGRCQRGASAVEFALLAPVLSIMLLGLLDYAIAVFHQMELSSAVRSGGQYALVDTTNSAAIVAVVEASTNLNTDNLTVTVTEFCECSDASSVACSGGTCASGSVRHYANVSASYVHTWLFLPGTRTLTESSILRTQ